MLIQHNERHDMGMDDGKKTYMPEYIILNSRLIGHKILVVILVMLKL